MKFCLRHSALQTKQDSVVKLARIVESILIQDQGVGECADFQEPVPVRGVARQSRNLQAEHNPGFFQTYFRYQLLKSCAIRGGRSRVTEVAVNNDDALDWPTQRYSTIGEDRIVGTCFPGSRIPVGAWTAGYIDRRCASDGPRLPFRERLRS